MAINTTFSSVSGSSVSAAPGASHNSGNGAATTSTTSNGLTSPRGEFFVSQRAADYELSKVDTLSLEEQELLANIQELQLQLMQLRAEQDEDSDDDNPAPQYHLAAPGGGNTTASGTPTNQLIVVSNNLPVLLERVPQSGRWKATKTTGGLDKLMCLTGVRSDLQFLWVGWVGQHIPKHEHESVRRLLLQHNCLPVFLSSDVAARHHGFSSEVLWSLFHYVSEPVAMSLSRQANFHSTKRFNKQDWRAYESANESFADAIAEIYNEGDAVWIHDYHLMLLPSLLRQRIPLCHIGWFLHTPFPSSDVYSRLPVRAQLLTGVLQADLVGFQTFDYERHFMSTCQRLLEVECSHKGVRSNVGDRDHFTSIGVFPIGINVEPFARAASSVQTLNRVNELHQKFGTKRIILGIDRLDNIKGIPHKLLAMETLLTRFPEWQHNVVLIQIGLSSRSGVVDSSSSSTSDSKATKSVESMGPPSALGSRSPVSSPTKTSSAIDTSASNATFDSSHQLEMSSHSYRNLLTHVNQLVGRINGVFGTLDYAPIHFIHQSATPHEELCALYDLADVCLVTSTRDGMNLVSHEFVVCQQHFMRRKEERKKAARAAARGYSNGSQESGRKSPVAPVFTSDFQAQFSPTKILTEWEGEEGGPGVLVLSEFAGSSQSLSGALVINPWNTEDVAVNIHQALSMCRAEREIRQQKLYRYVSTNTATSWSMEFLSDLRDAVLLNRSSSNQLPKLDMRQIVESYHKSHNRVIILDYDRTLTPQHSLLPLAAMGSNFKSLLDALSADENNTVFIVSGRERKFLETWLQGVRVGVAAEDGFFYRMNLQNDREHWKTMSKFQYDAAAARTGTSSSGGGGVGLDTSYRSPSDAQSLRSISMSSIPSYNGSYSYGGTNFTGAASTASAASVGFEEDDMSWKNLVLPTMLTFTDRTPGSYIEDKESSLTWHYADADPHFGGWQAKDLQSTLERQLIGSALEVYQGHLWLSVEHEGCTKTRVLEGLLKHLSLPAQIKKKQQHEVDFVLCVCDDVTDDQMFQTLNALVRESNERHEKIKQAAEAKAAAANTERIHEILSARGTRLTRSTSVGTGFTKKNGQGTGCNGKEAKTRHSSKTPKRKDPLPPHSGDPMEGQTSDDDDFVLERTVDEDNKVAFSRLHKVPVRMAENVSIFTVVVGTDVQHSGGPHSWSSAVDSLHDIRKVLTEFVNVSRKAGAIQNAGLSDMAGGSTPAAALAVTENLLASEEQVRTEAGLC